MVPGNKWRGFSLVELLAVVGMLGVLLALLLPAVQSARDAARRSHCASNIRQVGLAITQFCDVHAGRWPETTHTVEPDAETGKYDRAWIYTIAPFMEDVDAIRVCPSDLAGDLRLRGKGTSYAMNGWLSREARPPFDNRKKLTAMSKTIVAFELAEQKDQGAMRSGNPHDIDVFNDHVHSFNWFTTSRINSRQVYAAVAAEVAVDRHGGGAHYLYADGHVELLSGEQIHDWTIEPFNFARPPAQ